MRDFQCDKGRLSKVYAMLGLAQRARQVASGATAVENALSKGMVKCLVVATDLAPNSRKKFEKLARRAHVPNFVIGTMDELGGAIGKERRGVLGITDANFCSAIMAILEKERS